MRSCLALKHQKALCTEVLCTFLIRKKIFIFETAKYVDLFVP